MTTDSLERDLHALAEPQAGDLHLRTAIRATLGGQLVARPQRRRRARFALGGATVAAATAAAAIVALIGTGGPPTANAAILAHVVHAASTPAGMIVHVRETGTLSDGTRVAAEWWQETNAPYAMRLIKGPVGEEGESASDGTTVSQYDAASNTVYQQPDAAPPNLVDPVEAVRAELIAGTAHVDGTVTIDGRSLYKVVLADGVIGYFDRTNYQPVVIDNPQHDGSVVRTQVTAYEELPITAASRQLLSVAAQHPGARVATGELPAPAKAAGATK
jgi:hypothetical protein